MCAVGGRGGNQAGTDLTECIASRFRGGSVGIAPSVFPAKHLKTGTFWLTEPFSTACVCIA